MRSSIYQSIDGDLVLSPPDQIIRSAEDDASQMILLAKGVDEVDELEEHKCLLIAIGLKWDNQFKSS